MRSNEKFPLMFLLISIFFASISNIYAADNDKFKDVVIKTIEVRDGIYMLMGAGGNIGVSVGEDGVFLIDDQFAPLTPKIKAAILIESKAKDNVASLKNLKGIKNFKLNPFLKG